MNNLFRFMALYSASEIVILNKMLVFVLELIYHHFYKIFYEDIMCIEFRLSRSLLSFV